MLLAALALLLSTAAPAAAAGPENVPFPDGELAGFQYDDAYSGGSFENLSVSFDECGSGGSTECSWTVAAGIYCGSAECPGPIQVWQATGHENGTLQSGARSFGLDGAPGQRLIVSLDYTLSGFPPRDGGGWNIISQGGSLPLLDLRIGPSVESFPTGYFGESEETIRQANPAASMTPPPTLPHPSFSSNCRRLTIGGKTVMAFFFKRLGCRRAQALALAALREPKPPFGYRRVRTESGETRYARIGNRRKYFGWRPLPPG